RRLQAFRLARPAGGPRLADSPRGVAWQARARVRRAGPGSPADLPPGPRASRRARAVDARRRLRRRAGLGAGPDPVRAGRRVGPLRAGARWPPGGAACRRARAARGEGRMSRRLVIVVGSGDGGSFAAWRLARAGHPVLILEKGRNLFPELRAGHAPPETRFSN